VLLILIAALIIGAALGAGVGWLMRNSERFARVAPPEWTAFKEVRWGWRTGGITGILLAQHYIAANSPFPGSIVLVFELFFPFFAALGGGIGLLFATRNDQSNRG
jgi:hypothetical protein